MTDRFSVTDFQEKLLKSVPFVTDPIYHRNWPHLNVHCGLLPLFPSNLFFTRKYKAQQNKQTLVEKADIPIAKLALYFPIWNIPTAWNAKLKRTII